jgi:hypothetical protein
LVAVDDERLAVALAEWARDRREELAERGVRVELEGPFDSMGMDPVYLLRLCSSGNEAEATLFRGGTLLLATSDDKATEVRQSHVDALVPSDVTAALTALAESV